MEKYYLAGYFDAKASITLSGTNDLPRHYTTAGQVGKEGLVELTTTEKQNKLKCQIKTQQKGIFAWNIHGLMSSPDFMSYMKRVTN